jgi:hypothetical protein
MYLRGPGGDRSFALRSRSVPELDQLNAEVKFKEIVPGQLYAFREAPRQKSEFQQVRAIESVRSRWKVEWVEPNPGLTDYVKSVNLIVPWQERRALLREEESWERLIEACSKECPGYEHPLTDAVNIVLESTGENTWVGSKGEWSAMPDVLERIGQRAGMKLEIQYPAFLDRRGEAHLSFATAADLAQAFAASEPQTVLLSVEAEQRKYEYVAREPGNSHHVRLVQRWRAGWALCRQWAGFDEALAERDAEIHRLRRILDDLGYELRRAGQDKLVAKLERMVRGG